MRPSFHFTLRMHISGKMRWSYRSLGASEQQRSKAAAYCAKRNKAEGRL